MQYLLNIGLLRQIVLSTSPPGAERQLPFRPMSANHLRSPVFLMRPSPDSATRLADNGKIINLSSTTTRVLFPTYGLYSASKAAVEQATKVFAKEMGDRGISVNAVLPGPTKTELFLTGKSEEDLKRLSAVAAFNRIAEPEDIAKVILFLIGDEAGWINAQAIGVNGGFM